jgi:hypothetical protein
MSIAFMLQGDVLTVSFDSEVFQISKTDPSFAEVSGFIAKANKDALKKWYTNKKNSENKASEERVKQAEKIGCTVIGEQLYYNGEPVHNSLSEKIKQYISMKLPYQPLVNFMQNLMLNPSRNSVQQLFNFLQHKNLPITEDGCFLAYKAVNPTLLDIYSNSILNEIGSVVSISRNQVDDNPSNHCSSGLHCGALEYVKNYARQDSKILIVKVHPKDVVSVPLDHNFTKVRVCEYKVVDFYNQPLSSTYSGEDSESFRYESIDSYFEDENEDEDVDCDDYGDDYQEEEHDLSYFADFIYVNGQKYVPSNETACNTPCKTPCRDSKGRFCKSK